MEGDLLKDTANFEMDRRLATSTNFDHVFEIVRTTVEKSLRLHRAGLTLVLGDLPNYIGAYHVLGSNSIVMNRTILEAVKALSSSKLELNSFVYSILLHEYLHSLGYLDEGAVRRLVQKVTYENFGREHVASDMASRSLFEIYPQLKQLGSGIEGREFEVIKEFDRKSFPYIG